MIRLFVAVKIPDEVKAYLLDKCREIVDYSDHYRWENPDKIHLTLKFIGGVEENLVDPISEELDFIKKYNSLEFRITEFGFFFRDKLPKILWTGLETDERIYKLVKEVNQRLSIFSIPIETRKFKPHLTLLRIKKHPGNDFLNRFNKYKLENINFTSREITLMRSELSRAGARYTEIKKYILN